MGLFPQGDNNDWRGSADDWRASSRGYKNAKHEASADSAMLKGIGGLVGIILLVSIPCAIFATACSSKKESEPEPVKKQVVEKEAKKEVELDLTRLSEHNKSVVESTGTKTTKSVLKKVDGKWVVDDGSESK